MFTFPPSGAFFGFLSFGDEDDSMLFAAARAREAAVLAAETGSRGLELLNGGDFNGACSEIKAVSRGLGCRGGLELRCLGDFRGVLERDG